MDSREPCEKWSLLLLLCILSEMKALSFSPLLHLMENAMPLGSAAFICSKPNIIYCWIFYFFFHNFHHQFLHSEVGFLILAYNEVPQKIKKMSSRKYQIKNKWHFINHIIRENFINSWYWFIELRRGWLLVIGESSLGWNFWGFPFHPLNFQWKQKTLFFFKFPYVEVLRILLRETG